MKKETVKSIVKKCLREHLGTSVGSYTKNPMIDELCELIEEHYRQECKFCDEAKNCLTKNSKGVRYYKKA